MLFVLKIILIIIYNTNYIITLCSNSIFKTTFYIIFYKILKQINNRMFEITKIFKQKDYIYQFIPRNYEYLTKQKKIKFVGKNLKTDYLINIMDEMILKYFFTNDVKFNLWSEILRKKYACNL